MDELRSLRDRGMGGISGLPVRSDTLRSSGSVGSGIIPSIPSRWWYWMEHKSSVDDLLDESDQAQTVEDENAKIRKKCAWFFLSPLLVFCACNCY